MRVSLAAQRAEDDAPFAGGARGRDGGVAERVHFSVGVGFAREFARVGVVAVGGQVRVVDHGRFEMEAPVAEVEEEVDGWGGGEARGGAAEDLAFAEGEDLRDEDFVAGAFEKGLERV